MHRIEAQVRDQWVYACSPRGFAHIDSASDAVEKWRAELGGLVWGTGAGIDTLNRPPLAAMIESGITGVTIDEIQTNKGPISREMVAKHCLNPLGLPSAKRIQEAPPGCRAPLSPIAASRSASPMAPLPTRFPK